MENIKNPGRDKNTREDLKDQTKTGVVPNEELNGSDADKAYDENGEFNQLDKTNSDQAGADADEDK